MREKMTVKERKALANIQRVGDDRQLVSKSWDFAKLSLYRRGLIRRRVGDWRWIAVSR